MRLIDCDAFLQTLANIGYGTDYDGDLYFAYMSGANTIIGLLEDAPTLTPESLVKRGRWMEVPGVNDIRETWVACSECNYQTTSMWKKDCNFCPNCGAKMVKEDA